MFDKDFDLTNNYKNKDYKLFYGGDLDTHLSENSTNNKNYSIHGYGLPLLLSPIYYGFDKLNNFIPIFMRTLKNEAIEVK